MAGESAKSKRARGLHFSRRILVNPNASRKDWTFRSGWVGNPDLKTKILFKITGGRFGGFVNVSKNKSKKSVVFSKKVKSV